MAGPQSNNSTVAASCNTGDMTVSIRKTFVHLEAPVPSLNGSRLSRSLPNLWGSDPADVDTAVPTPELTPRDSADASGEVLQRTLSTDTLDWYEYPAPLTPLAHPLARNPSLPVAKDGRATAQRLNV